ncbi:hypothetical protein VYU27_005808 [Nannochloropsis oceanica]
MEEVGEGGASSEAASDGGIRSILSRLGQGTLNPSQAEEALLALQQQQQQQQQQQKEDKGYDSVDSFAKIDYVREARTGLPEIIYGEGKTPEQLLAILHSMGERRRAQEEASGDLATTHVNDANPSEGNLVEMRSRVVTGGEGEEGQRAASADTTAPRLSSSSPLHRPAAAAHGVIVASRVSSEKYAALRESMKGEGGREGGRDGGMDAYGTLEYMPVPRLLVLRPRGKEGGRDGGREERRTAPSLGLVTVMCAGTADLSVAEEAATVAELCGVEVQRVYDVGVAGIHRLFAALDTIKRSHVVVCVAGMDGALPTVVAGLLPCPVIAVPTSVGYGVGKDGLAPLLTMLNACAPGVACVNIDNGIGAAGMAVKILRHTGNQST